MFIPEPGRGTLCISSQVGCAMDCSFCSTAQQGFNRNLTAAEIVGQVWLANRELGYRPGGDRVVTNVVFMGMGEPLANYRNVVPAAEIMMDDLGFDLSRRRVTVSTSGLVPQMLQLAEETNCALAVSLHAPNDALRDELVPINRKHPIAELLDACWQYVNKQNARSITFEYVMLDGVNDQPEHARELAPLLQGPAGEGQPDSVQSVPGHALPALERRGDRAVPRHPQYERRDRDDAAHARRRHRRRLRPAGRPRERPHDSASGLEAHLSGGATVKRAATVVAMLASWRTGAAARATSTSAVQAAAGARRRDQPRDRHRAPAQGQPAAGEGQDRPRARAESAQRPRRTWSPACCTTGSATQSKAESHFERAVRSSRRTRSSRTTTPPICASRSKYERGEKLALEAAADPLYKTPEVAYMNAGNCARSAGDLKGAEENFRKALAVKPRFGEALFQMADLEYRQTEYLSARAFLERYLEVGRTSPATLWLGVRIERGLGNTRAAQHYAQRLKSEYPSAAQTKELLESERNPG